MTDSSQLLGMALVAMPLLILARLLFLIPALVHHQRSGSLGNLAAIAAAVSRLRTAGSLLALLVGSQLLSACSPSPEDIDRQQREEMKARRAAERDYCIKAADTADAMYTFYQGTHDIKGMYNVVERQDLENHYTPFQYDTMRKTIAFVVLLPADLPVQEAGHRWIKDHCLADGK